ncbi:hypothetical protein LshimejAT787_1203340 [Lyophyllum shimeji]|uniref:Uncharacterized protein n=1 Tax=Lyophyllum shimeji TaxID=47721 RepID=A0A9P3PU22_LYOSH|nr:hypothetical protein LshimejAT787_1203340 [Lyophyllum shimeji]
MLRKRPIRQLKSCLLSWRTVEGWRWCSVGSNNSGENMNFLFDNVKTGDGGSGTLLGFGGGGGNYSPSSRSTAVGHRPGGSLSSQLAVEVAATVPTRALCLRVELSALSTTTQSDDRIRRMASTSSNGGFMLPDFMGVDNVHLVMEDSLGKEIPPPCVSGVRNNGLESKAASCYGIGS